MPLLLWSNADIHPLSADTPHDQLFALFPVNAADNVVHGLLGLWGLAAARSGRAAILFARAMTGIFALLTLGGFVPAAGDVLRFTATTSGCTRCLRRFRPGSAGFTMPPHRHLATVRAF